MTSVEHTFEDFPVAPTVVATSVIVDFAFEVLRLAQTVEFSFVNGAQIDSDEPVLCPIPCRKSSPAIFHEG